MPETLEPIMHQMVAKHIFEPLRHSCDWQLRGIWADGTDAEQLAATNRDSTRDSTRMKHGLVYELNSNSRIKRGHGAQGYVWPHIPGGIPDVPCRLQDIYCHARSMRLDFGSCVLQVCSIIFYHIF